MEMGQLPGPLGWLWQPDGIVAIQRVFGREGRLVFEIFSLLGGAQITLIAVAWARWCRGRALAARLLVALFLGIGVDLLIWNLYPTPRPDDPGVWVATPIPISSFPSGHLVTVLTLWGTLAAVRIIAPLGVGLIAVLVALSRLALGAHYPGDVLGGVVVGLVLLVIIVGLWPRLIALSGRLSWPAPLIFGGVVAGVALLAAPVTPHGRWVLLGLLAGVAVGLPLESRYVGFDPVWRGWRPALPHLLLGAVGLLPLVLLTRLAHDVPLVASLLVPALAALWIMLGAPLAFKRFEVARARRVAGLIHR